MIHYYIEDSHKFIYYTDSETPVDVRITVYEHNLVVYTADLNLIRGVNYFTSLVSGWNNKEVVIMDKTNNQEVSFNMVGDFDKLSELQALKMNKYCKRFTLPDKTELCDIMNKQGSDKASRPELSGSAGHNYTKFYNRIFQKYRHDEINLFELS